MRTNHSHPGFTLIEMLVATGIAVLAIAMASMAMVSQIKAMHALDQRRGANGSSRQSMLQLEETLRRAGWGVDPRFALDFWYNPASPLGATCASPCRDGVDNGSDELVFTTRDPDYNWLAPGQGTCPTTGSSGQTGCFTGHAGTGTVSLAGSTATVNATLQAPLPLMPGQVFEFLCSPNGTSPVMLTYQGGYVASTGDAGTTALSFSSVSTPADPYNNPTGVASCLSSNAMVFLVNRYRYFVQSFDGGVGTTPWLMLDTGLDLNHDGTIGNSGDLIPIAKDVEDMQVMYGLVPDAGAGPDSNGDWVIGNDPGHTGAEEPYADDGGTQLNPYSTPFNSPLRYTMDVANVRQVTVSLRIRGDQIDQTHATNWTGDVVPYSGNRTGTLNAYVPNAGGYRQYTSETTIDLRNMNSTSPFIF